MALIFSVSTNLILTITEILPKKKKKKKNNTAYTAQNGFAKQTTISSLREKVK